MKKWMMGTAALVCLVASTPSAWAADSLWRHHSSPAGGHAEMRAVAQSTGAVVGRVAPTSGPEMSDEHPGHGSDIKSSVQLSRSVLREAYVASRAAYTEKLQKYAKCSTAEAKKAVLAAHPGMKVDDIQLRNIRTNLVYMAIAENDQDKFFVVVDAGNGKILMDRPLPTHHERVFSQHD
ncbi:hypothetical protein JI721_11905 [Alicyclobacillus cycloheptanicus]|uniref:PepSY domain-containing protein n=1 Tax=Alicyclobacillus cycloheptanicus TaxID=1457 RepID=A0ABT9XGS2_9BACL|nr:hypothetical protein [Alicyclobacillus cycloheptanicus]MDQ0189244.1 hypothetical protein [Alicyclobacillus cycloheptanicus]WDM00428.1 hypothetical protein JI721_11905 [Alicyclobacillus cycloheptanicus]